MKLKYIITAATLIFVGAGCEEQKSIVVQPAPQPQIVEKIVEKPCPVKNDAPDHYELLGNKVLFYAPPGVVVSTNIHAKGVWAQLVSTENMPKLASGKVDGFSYMQVGVFPNPKKLGAEEWAKQSAESGYHDKNGAIQAVTLPAQDGTFLSGIGYQVSAMSESPFVRIVVSQDKTQIIFVSENYTNGADDAMRAVFKKVFESIQVR